MQAVSKQNIDKWIRHNEWGIWDNLALKREDKPKPRQAKQAAKTSSRFAWRQVLVRYLLDIAKMAIACAIGVALGLMFVWAW
mgnify:CR=1 FL=1